MNIIKAAVISALLTLFIGACVPVPLILGGASGGAVYSTTNDHIKDVFSISKEQAFETMIGLIAAENGQVTKSSMENGNIEAKVGKSLLFVTITPLNERQIEVSIRAKKYNELIPDKDAAVKFYRSFVKEVSK